MRKAEVNRLLDQIDELPTAGMTVAETRNVRLNLAHVGNLVTVRMQPPVDPDVVEQLNAAFEREYYVDMSNLTVGYWSLLAEGAHPDAIDALS